MKRVRLPAAALLAATSLAWPCGVAVGQAIAERPTGWEFAGVPALGYNSGDGFIYGALLEAYQYGDGSAAPYVLTVQPSLVLSTEGKRELRLFFDAPHLLPPGWRLDAFLASEEEVATPFYGIGNATIYDERLEAEPNPFYYRFGRIRRQLRGNIQRDLGVGPYRVLAGFAATNVSLDPVPFDSGTTLVDFRVNSTLVRTGWWNSVRVGLVRDTRDREIGPTAGSWTEAIVQHVPEWLGSEATFSRLTVADRRYLTLGPGLVLANRILAQQVMGSAPFYELFLVESSFRQQEGLGGAKTVRGLPKNRYVGKGMLIWNLEARWRATDFSVLSRSFGLVLSAFLDGGRVWAGDMVLADALTDLHFSYGGGVRFAMGESFVVAVDVGFSGDELIDVDGARGTVPMGLYIGLGYLF